MKTLTNPRFGVLAVLVLLAALTRLLPHPPNFTAVGAMALFGGAFFSNRVAALLVPLASLWISDLVLNNVVYSEYNPSFAWFTPGGYWMYGGFALVVGLGILLLEKVNFTNLLAASLSASVLFYLVTNFGVWYGSSMYPATREGLVACYVAAIPFFGNTLAGDLFFCGVLFGMFGLAQRRFPALVPKKA